jgi:hypothetical protein
MDRPPTVLWVALFATTLLALTPIATWWAEQESATSGLRPTGGRVELEIDEQDVGVVERGQPLDVCFVVGNLGSQRLLLRQTPIEEVETPANGLPTYSVSPGQRVAITARATAEDLVPQGVTHVLFLTSDEACPRLWLSIRGTVQSVSRTSRDSQD